MSNIKEMTNEEIRGVAQKYCSKNEFELLDIRSLPHPDDFYLKFVVAYSARQKEYVTWLLNLDIGGLNEGHYFSHYFDGRIDDNKDDAYLKAMADFMNRR